MTYKEPLLFLCHRIPFPPNKGDKIRSFNMLKKLAQHYDVYLASFVDDPYDWQYASKLDKYCKQTFLRKQNKLVSKIKGTRAFLTGEAISLPYYADASMRTWVKNTVASRQISKVFVYSSVMAQYLTDEQLENMQCVVDFVDVDSDKWRQYAEGKSGIAKWIYAREHLKLASFETKVASLCAHSIFVSPQEAELFRRQVSKPIHDQVHGVLNGVDTAFFDPAATLNKVESDSVDIVFTGAMDYWANIDAVMWFAKYVLPIIQKSRPDICFYIVGGNPSEEVRALHNKNGIVVTGRVEDVRPYILQAKVCIAPLQIARGIQNKVLEAMAMSKPVVATSMAIEGIDAKTQFIDVTDAPTDFAEKVIERCLKVTEAPDNREWIMANLQWKATLSTLPEFFESQ